MSAVSLERLALSVALMVFALGACRNDAYSLEERRECFGGEDLPQSKTPEITISYRVSEREWFLIEQSLRETAQKFRLSVFDHGEQAAGSHIFLVFACRQDELLVSTRSYLFAQIYDKQGNAVRHTDPVMGSNAEYAMKTYLYRYGRNATLSDVAQDLEQNLARHGLRPKIQMH